ncbi:MAG: site-specific integrase [Chitinispirillales bacterium]|jgi:integrase|nr:site-specific integrase [Chitinispirillales bacterium]
MMQQYVDSCGGKADTQARVKNLFYNLDREAIGLDVIKHGYSELIRVSAPVRKERQIFSDIEVGRLWDAADEPWVDTVLILLYSGWRISELLALKVEDINLDMGIMRGGAKTKAGKDRVVPIHRLIMPLIKNRLRNCKFRLIENGGAPVGYDTYLYFFRGAMGKLEINHTIHETRHTFRTWLDRASAPLSCVNRIMGHVCGDVGLQTYTHKVIEELRAAVDLIATEQKVKIKAVGSK